MHGSSVPDVLKDLVDAVSDVDAIIQTWKKKN